MKDTELYSQILGIEKPWKVVEVQVSLAEDEVQVTVARSGVPLRCPKCGKACPGYDQRARRWRHLDTCQLKTVLLAEVPRAQCAEHGVVIELRLPKVQILVFNGRKFSGTDQK